MSNDIEVLTRPAAEILQTYDRLKAILTDTIAEVRAFVVTEANEAEAAGFR